MKLRDKQINFYTFLFSLLIHAALFIQFSDAAMSKSQAQAPVYDTRVSLNLLKPVKPEIQQEIKPKPVKKIKPVKKKREKKLIKKVKEQPVVQQAVAKKVADEVKRDKEALSRQRRQSYLDYVLTHIEGHKYYPHSARLRNIEGSIQVSFVLQKDGSISELSANGSSILLRRAAKGSVNKALPLPACPEDVECPIQVNYAMQFQIK
ncbi:MAG: energy transducer TonB [Gammaproteobacteria bacterium]|nr:energy transducer TonB [Gammaproteobacteria bacterium]MCW8987531.1 energy transducer TonB [Gammaproteobacteria bacterium]MCW9029989.1 energy transducer TonB [Gammaproteobacteria bacterium]